MTSTFTWQEIASKLLFNSTVFFCFQIISWDLSSGYLIIRACHLLILITRTFNSCMKYCVFEQYTCVTVESNKLAFVPDFDTVCWQSVKFNFGVTHPMHNSSHLQVILVSFCQSSMADVCGQITMINGTVSNNKAAFQQHCPELHVISNHVTFISVNVLRWVF